MKRAAWVLWWTVATMAAPAAAQEAIKGNAKIIRGTASIFDEGPVIPDTGQSTAEAAIKAGVDVAKRRVGTSVLQALGKSLGKSAVGEIVSNVAGEAFQSTIGKGVISTTARGNALDFDNNPLYFAWWDHPDYTPEILEGHRHLRIGASAVWLTGYAVPGEITCDPEFVGLTAFGQGVRGYPSLEESKHFRAHGTDWNADLHRHAKYCEQREGRILGVQKHRAAGGHNFGTMKTEPMFEDSLPLSKKRYAALSSRRFYYRPTSDNELHVLRSKEHENTLILTIQPGALVKFPFADDGQGHLARFEYCGPGMTYRPWDHLYGRHKSQVPVFQVEVAVSAEIANAVFARYDNPPRGREWDTVFFKVGDPEPMQSRFRQKTYRVPLTIEAIRLAVQTDPKTRSEASTIFLVVNPPAASNTCGKEASLWPPL